MTLLHCLIESLEYLLKDFFAVHISRRLTVRAGDLRVLQEVGDEAAHALRSFQYRSQEHAPFFAEVGSATLLEQLGKDSDVSKRLLQVMGSGKGKLFKSLVGAAKIFFRAFLLIDIGTSPNPFDNGAVLATNRQRSTEVPAIAHRAPV